MKCRSCGSKDIGTTLDYKFGASSGIGCLFTLLNFLGLPFQSGAFNTVKDYSLDKYCKKCGSKNIEDPNYTPPPPVDNGLEGGCFGGESCLYGCLLGPIVLFVLAFLVLAVLAGIEGGGHAGGTYR
jgi:ribosomal protein L40E